LCGKRSVEIEGKKRKAFEEIVLKLRCHQRVKQRSGSQGCCRGKEEEEEERKKKSSLIREGERAGGKCWRQ